MKYLLTLLMLSYICIAKDYAVEQRDASMQSVIVMTEMLKLDKEHKISFGAYKDPEATVHTIHIFLPCIYFINLDFFSRRAVLDLSSGEQIRLEFDDRDHDVELITIPFASTFGNSKKIFKRLGQTNITKISFKCRIPDGTFPDGFPVMVNINLDKNKQAEVRKMINDVLKVK